MLFSAATRTKQAVQAALDQALPLNAGKPVAVMTRTAAELAAVRDANPFPDAPGNRVIVTLLDELPPSDAIAFATNRQGGQSALGRREIHVAPMSSTGPI